jgi:hypothetical protein
MRRPNLIFTYLHKDSEWGPDAEITKLEGNAMRELLSLAIEELKAEHMENIGLSNYMIK